MWVLAASMICSGPTPNRMESEHEGAGLEH